MSGFRFDGCEHPYSVLVCPNCNQELCWECGGYTSHPYDSRGLYHAKCSCGAEYDYSDGKWWKVEGRRLIEL